MELLKIYIQNKQYIQQHNNFNAVIQRKLLFSYLMSQHQQM